MRDDPLQSLLDVRERAATGIREDLQRDDIRASRDTTVNAVLRRDDARHMRAVARPIRRIVVAVAEVVLIDDSVGDAVAVGIRSKERMIDVDTRVDHHDAVAGAIQPAETWVGFQAVEVDEILGRSRRRTGNLFAWQHQFDARTGQRDLRCSGVNALLAAAAIQCADLIGREAADLIDSRRRVGRSGRAWERLLKAIRRRFEDDVGSGAQIDERVRAISDRHLRRFGVIERAVAVAVLIEDSVLVEV